MSIEELLKKASNLRNHEEFDEALEILETLYQENQSSEEVKTALINTLFSYGNYLCDELVLEHEKSIGYYEKILAIEPDNYRAHYNLGLSYFYIEKWDDAMKEYMRAVELKPDYKYAYYNIGLIHEAENNLEEALKFYNKAIQIDKDFSYALHARIAVQDQMDQRGLDSGTSSEDVMISSQSAEKDRERLISLLKVSKRLKLEFIQELLALDKKNLYDLLIEWCKTYDFELDGDFLIINKERVGELVDNLS